MDLGLGLDTRWRALRLCARIADGGYVSSGEGESCGNDQVMPSPVRAGVGSMMVSASGLAMESACGLKQLASDVGGVAGGLSVRARMSKAMGGATFPSIHRDEMT